MPQTIIDDTSQVEIAPGERFLLPHAHEILLAGVGRKIVSYQPDLVHRSDEFCKII